MGQFRHLVKKAQTGDEEAITQIIRKLEPILRKCERKLPNDDAQSELILWLLTAIKRYHFP